MKKIDDDYLWDRTGEPDPEIQQLEQMLGSLRYQPRPLDLPAELSAAPRRAFLPSLLTIAATIAIMLLGAGLWLAFHKQPITPVSKVAPVNPVVNETAGVANKDNGSTAPVPPQDQNHKPARHRLNRGVLPHEFARNRRPTASTLELAAGERKEAEAAKEQLILALRVASSKLSFAQKKAQEINSENMVHNQHKTG